MKQKRGDKSSTQLRTHFEFDWTFTELINNDRNRKIAIYQISSTRNEFKSLLISTRTNQGRCVAVFSPWKCQHDSSLLSLIFQLLCCSPFVASSSKSIIYCLESKLSWEVWWRRNRFWWCHCWWHSVRLEEDLWVCVLYHRLRITSVSVTSYLKNN